MSALLLALALLAGLNAIAAGPTLAALGPRWRRLWPLVAPPVGLALLVVAAEVPSQFVGARVYGPWLAAGLLLAGVGTLVTFRRELRWRDLPWLGLPLAVLPLGLLPYFGEGLLTTLSEHNHDYVYYHALEQQLIEAGYGAGEGDASSLFDRLGWVLRRGGWRAGLPIAASVVASIGGLLPHQVDGSLWAVCHAMYPGAVLASFRLIAPRSSLLARVFVTVAAGASAPALLSLRMTFASHLASLPLFVLLWALTARGLHRRPAGLRLLAALVLAASISVLADAIPYLVALLGTAALARWRSIPRPSPQELALRFRPILLGVALVPFALHRVYLSIVSLTRTGYHGPAADFSADLPSLLGPALSVQGHLAQIEELPKLVTGAALGAATLAALVLLLSIQRVPAATRGAVGAPLLLSVVLAALAAPLGHAYPLWKLAITTGPFVLIGLAVGADRTPRRLGASMAALLLAGQAVTLVHACRFSTDSAHGVRRPHESLVRRVVEGGWTPYLVGHHDEADLAHEHALVYLFRAHGVVLRAHPHPRSYYWVSWPTPQLADGSPNTVAIVVRPDRAMVEGRALFETPIGTVIDVGGGYAANLALEEGFTPFEVEPGRRFTWSDRSARMRVELPWREGCLTAEARTIPDGTGRALVVDRHAVPDLAAEPDFTAALDTTEVPIGLDWDEVVLAGPGGPRVLGLSLGYAGRRVEPLVDARSIFVAFAGFRARPREHCERLAARPRP